MSTSEEKTQPGKVITSFQTISSLIRLHVDRVFIRTGLGPGEIVQCLRALDVLAKDKGSIPSSHMAAIKCL